jgi:nitroreductase
MRSQNRLSVFRDIVKSRYSAFQFAKDTPVPTALLLDLLELTVDSPTSFNFQPYKIIVVQSKTTKDLIAANAMLGGNGRKVTDAPATIVFATHRGIHSMLLL